MSKYKRILLKLSGEALVGDKGHGISRDILEQFSKEIKKLVDLKTEVGIVIGGGNIHRGVSGAAKGMNRATSDYMGMLATMINALALKDALLSYDVPTKVLSAVEMNTIAESYTYRTAVEYLQQGTVLVFAGGTGNPYFTTDTAAALRASEIGADVLMKATKVDGVFDKDPAVHSDATMFDNLAYKDVLSRELKVMDLTAVTLCMDNNIDIVVFNAFGEDNMRSVVKGEHIGTRVSK